MARAPYNDPHFSDEDDEKKPLLSHSEDDKKSNSLKLANIYPDFKKVSILNFESTIFNKSN